MTDSGDPGKKRGRPRAGDARKARNTRATRSAADGQTPAAVTTVARGRDYEGMYADHLEGVDRESIARKYGLSLSRVSEVLDQLCADPSWAFESRTRWDMQRRANELLLRRFAAAEEAADLVVRARASGNIATESAASRYRDDALSRLEIALKETGLLPFEKEFLKVQLDVAQTIGEILEVFTRHGVPEHVIEEVLAVAELRIASGPTGQKHLAEMENRTAAP